MLCANKGTSNTGALSCRPVSTCLWVMYLCRFERSSVSKNVRDSTMCNVEALIPWRMPMRSRDTRPRKAFQRDGVSMQT